MNTSVFFITLLNLLASFSHGVQNEPVKYSTSEFLETAGYPVETHYLTTTDGYILLNHRIPTGRNVETNGKVALLVHGLLSSSVQWVLNGPGKGLAYILSDHGYDVWMINCRGNHYSRNHTHLDPDHEKILFWNFSWHEIALHDIPETIDYILGKTGRTGVYYVGFSQGTTTMFAMLSELPQYNEKVKAYVSLSPVVFMSHLDSLLFRIPAALLKAGVKINPISEELKPSHGVLHQIGEQICSGIIGRLLCLNVIFLMFGFSHGEIDQNIVPELSLHFPAGSSTKQFIHYLQEINSGQFRPFEEEDVKMMNNGNNFTADYNLSAVSAPGYLIYSDNDLIADHIIDIPRLINSLKNCRGKILIRKYNHLDFIFGSSAPYKVFNTIIKLFSHY